MKTGPAIADILKKEGVEYLFAYPVNHLIEACAVGVPVLIGPFTRNFEAASEMAIRAGAAKRATTANEIVDMAFELLGDPQTRMEMGHAGRAFCAQHQGATEKTARIATRLLENGSPHKEG